MLQLLLVPCVLHDNAGQTLVVCLRFLEDKAMFLLR